MGRNETLKAQYFSWLYSLVSDRRPSYRLLCMEMHKKPFRWYIRNDDNRCDDGIHLREVFVEEFDLDEDHLEVQYFMKGECTILEVLVALAQRIDEQLFNLEDHKNRTSKWFKEMISNLGLDKFTDDYDRQECYSPVTEAEINETLEKLVSRQYDFYGRGGLFPLKRRPPQDQTEVEIWYQLMLYLDENYGL